MLDVWKATLADLAADPELLVGKADWVTKRWLFRQFMAREKIEWTDPWLKAQDLEFHQVDPARSLGLALARTPEGWVLSDKEIADATNQAPQNTRAGVRSRLMKLLQNHSLRYFVDWEVIDAEGLNSLNLLNPFDAAPKEADDWSRDLIHGRG